MPLEVIGKLPSYVNSKLILGMHAPSVAFAPWLVLPTSDHLHKVPANLDVRNIVARSHTEYRWVWFKCWQASTPGDTTLPGRATRKHLAHDRPRNDRKETRF
jgi:hypothetical protein